MSIHQEIYDGHQVSTGRMKPTEMVAEYEHRYAEFPEIYASFQKTEENLVFSATIRGTYGRTSFRRSDYSLSSLQANLLKSAWMHFYDTYNLKMVMSAKDKTNFDRFIENPLPFTLDNIRDVFGDYIADPRGAILRGLAEAFCALDPVYRSHEKMKVGVKGLPKRVIFHGGGLGSEWGGLGTARTIINAIAAYVGLPLVENYEMSVLQKIHDAMKDGGEYPDPYAGRYETAKMVTVSKRGIWVKKFANGNWHMFFDEDNLRLVNLALREYYGEVLPDCPDDEDRPDKPAHTGTEVAKDLQYYPTPERAIHSLLRDCYLKDAKVLEPSCGTGNIMDAVVKEGGKAFGVEVDQGRADIARSKGHTVTVENFLKLQPDPLSGWADFDLVAMNPPFYGKHYAKHVKHALKFLKPNGKLVAVLPSTARYDHGLLDEFKPDWCDLPVGTFSESGTNVNTTICTIRKRDVK